MAISTEQTQTAIDEQQELLEAMREAVSHVPSYVERPLSDKEDDKFMRPLQEAK